MSINGTSVLGILLVRMNGNLPPVSSYFLILTFFFDLQQDKLTGMIPLVKSVGYLYSLLRWVFCSTLCISGTTEAAGEDRRLPAMRSDCRIIILRSFVSSTISPRTGTGSLDDSTVFFFGCVSDPRMLLLAGLLAVFFAEDHSGSVIT